MTRPSCSGGQGGKFEVTIIPMAGGGGGSAWDSLCMAGGCVSPRLSPPMGSAPMAPACSGWLVPGGAQSHTLVLAASGPIPQCQWGRSPELQQVSRPQSTVYCPALSRVRCPSHCYCHTSDRGKRLSSGHLPVWVTHPHPPARHCPQHRAPQLRC